MAREILVLEDEALIAMDIEMTLQGAGHDGVRVFHDVASAEGYLDGGVPPPSAALLDVNLGGGETSFAVARRLLDAEVPFVFLTGYTAGTVGLPEELRDVPRISKPFRDDHLLGVIGAMMERAAA